MLRKLKEGSFAVILGIWRTKASERKLVLVRRPSHLHVHLVTKAFAILQRKKSWRKAQFPWPMPISAYIPWHLAEFFRLTGTPLLVPPSWGMASHKLGNCYVRATMWNSVLLYLFSKHTKVTAHFFHPIKRIITCPQYCIHQWPRSCRSRSKVCFKYSGWHKFWKSLLMGSMCMRQPKDSY